MNFEDGLTSCLMDVVAPPTASECTGLLFLTAEAALSIEDIRLASSMQDINFIGIVSVYNCSK